MLAGWVPMKTLAVQRTINFGALIPEELLLTHEDGLLPGVQLKTEDPKTGYKKIQYINQICLLGADTFRTSQTGPLVI